MRKAINAILALTILVTIVVALISPIVIVAYGWTAWFWTIAINWTIFVVSRILALIVHALKK
jgi:hypothetical protein